MRADTRMGTRLEQRQIQTQTLSVDIEATIDFWRSRLNEMGQKMGAPSGWIKKLNDAHNNDYKIVEFIVMDNEKILLNEVVRVIKLLYSQYFNQAPRTKKPFSVLEVGCGTGNVTLELARLEAQEMIELTSGDILMDAVDHTVKKLIENNFSRTAQRVHQLLATSLTKKVKDPLLADQKVFDRDKDKFDLIIKGRIGHRLLGEAWAKSYREVAGMLSREGIVLFYEPLEDVNRGRLNSSARRELRSTQEYEKLFKSLKMRKYLWNMIEVFDQIYVIGVFSKS